MSDLKSRELEGEINREKTSLKVEEQDLERANDKLTDIQREVEGKQKEFSNAQGKVADRVRKISELERKRSEALAEEARAQQRRVA